MFLTKLKVAMAVLLVGGGLGVGAGGFSYAVHGFSAGQARQAAATARQIAFAADAASGEQRGQRGGAPVERAAEPASSPKKGGNSQPQKERPIDTALIDRLIRQLGSEKFDEREAALKRLKQIGAPALGALREAARKSSDAEVRRRAEQLIQHAEQLAERAELSSLANLLQQGVKFEQQKDYKKAAETLDRAIKMALEKHRAELQDPSGDIPFLTEAFIHSARVSRELQDFTKAASCYQRAQNYANHNTPKRREINREWSGMVSQLLSHWSEPVRKKVEDDPNLKKLTSEYPLVFLHSRRYAGGGYLQSTYSFLYKTTDETKHFNDVQLQFDNGRGDRTFQVNMVNGQENRVADLEDVDFRQDPDPEKVPQAGKNGWHANECLAVEGHVYLEKVEDSQGNRFCVVFKVIAVDKESRYMAFIWRQLPGGKVVKRP
jgi:tetratricopeptide (TPR) repeat protein